MEQTTRTPDNELVRRCMERTGIKTQEAVIDYALRELLRRESQLEILQLTGSVFIGKAIWRKAAEA